MFLDRPRHGPGLSRGLALLVLMVFAVGAVEGALLLGGSLLFAGGLPELAWWHYPAGAFALGALHLALEALAEIVKGGAAWVRRG